jgi:acetoacetyl-CoA synthetase
VPAKIYTVSDFPRTRSGKISELAVRNIIHNKKLKNIEALMNPEVLELFKNIEGINN